MGLRMPGMGVGLRTGCGVARFSGGGIVDFRFEGTVEGGSGVVRFSGGGIVDLRDDEGDADGGRGVTRLSDGGTVDLRDEGNSVERAAITSSSFESNTSPLRGSAAGVTVEDRRDEPRAEPCG